MGSIGPIITIIGSILLVLIKAWQDGAPARDKETRDEEIQKGRRDIADGNVAAVSVRIDEATRGVAGVGAGASEGGDSDTLRRLAALGVIPGEAPGESGGMPR